MAFVLDASISAAWALADEVVSFSGVGPKPFER